MALRKQRSGEAKEEQGLTNDSNQTQLLMKVQILFLKNK